jgi:hypothetical protein
MEHRVKTGAYMVETLDFDLFCAPVRRNTKPYRSQNRFLLDRQSEGYAFPHQQRAML